MQDLSPMLMAMLLSVCLSLSVLSVLSRPLARVLVRICPDEAAAAFWVRYTQVMLTLAPLLVALLAQWLVDGTQAVAALRLTLLATLGGLLLGLQSVGRRLGAFVRAAAPAEEPASPHGRT